MVGYRFYFMFMEKWWLNVTEVGSERRKGTKASAGLARTASLYFLCLDLLIQFLMLW